MKVTTEILTKSGKLVKKTLTEATAIHYLCEACCGWDREYLKDCRGGTVYCPLYHFRPNGKDAVNDKSKAAPKKKRKAKAKTESRSTSTNKKTPAVERKPVLRKAVQKPKPASVAPSS